MEQSGEAVCEPVGIVNLVERDHRIDGRLLVCTALGYQLETVAPLNVGDLAEVETRSMFLLGEVIYLSPQSDSWVCEFKIKHRIRKSACLLNCR
jgi:hypothetical protein